MFHPILPKLNAQRNILASGSPRRKLILENVGLKIEVVPSTFEENIDKSKISCPEEYVLETARSKVEEVVVRLASSQAPTELVIGADTVVSQDNQIIEKPKDKDDAFRILSSLSGRIHEVFTGVIIAVPAKSAVLLSGKPLADGQYRYTSFVEKSEVHMAEMTSDVIHHYIETGEPMDKAGGYGIQAIGGTLVEKINGDYFNVMGFPLSRFSKLLMEMYSQTS